MNDISLRAVLKNHTDGVSQIAFSPDGKTLASGCGVIPSKDPVIRIWDTNEGKLICRFEGHTALIKSLKFSPNGAFLASCSPDKTIRIWDMESRKLRASLVNHNDFVSNIAFSPDGKSLASCSDETIRIWDVSNWEEKAILRGHIGVIGLEYSPDGVTLASVSPLKENIIHLWNVSTGKQHAILEGHTKGVYKAISFTLDGKLLISGSFDKTIRLWDTQSGNQEAVLTHTDNLRGFALHPNGKLLISLSSGYGGKNPLLHIWKIPSGQKVKEISVNGDGNLVISPDGALLLLTKDNPASILVLSTATWKETSVLAVEAQTIYTVAFNPDGTLIACGSDDNLIRLWTRPVSESTPVEKKPWWKVW